MSIYNQVNKPLLRRLVEPVQYTSIRYTDRLDELGAAPSVGSRGDAYDNAMAEAWVATFKSELVDGRRFPSYEHAEHETLNWIGFYNGERLHEELGDLPPTEYEEMNYKTVVVAAASGRHRRGVRMPAPLRLTPVCLGAESP